MKARLVDWLISNEKNHIICSELIFFEGKRRADIVSIGDSLSVYEIKGDHDKLTNIISQVRDYQLCFDYVYVVTTIKHASKLTKMLPRSVGIICINEEGSCTIQKRKAHLRKRLNKELLSSLLPRKLILSLLRERKSGLKLPEKYSVTDLRRILARTLNQSEIHLFAVNYLKRKHSENYKTFLSERGGVTHPDDLLLLTSKPNEITHRDPTGFY
jgi:hypothetical protein